MNVARSFNNWISNRRTSRELGRLSNRMLIDIGAVREEVKAFIRVSAR